MVNEFNWSGIIHIDLRYDEYDKQIKVIEMNPRFWGSLPASFFAGVNFPYIACLAGLNLDLPEIVIQHKRVIHPKATISLLAKRLTDKKQKKMHFDNSIIEFLLKDPLPLIYSEFSKIYNKR
jgi:predicted ATP-grasp superfamily ATP-dependent carboligase